MKKVILNVLVSVLFLFIAVNIVLIITNDNVKRSQYIESYKLVKHEDLKKSFTTKGVVKPEEEYSVPTQGKLGEISSVLVNKGDHVESGQALIEYNSEKIDQEILLLEQRIESLETQESMVDTEIADLQSQIDDLYTFEESQFNTEPEFDEEDNEDDDRALQMQEQQLNQAIQKKENEQQKLEQERLQVENQITMKESEKEAYTITSKLSGTVTEVNPYASGDGETVMTIRSDSPFLITGKLTEEEIIKVKEGQEIIAAPNVKPGQKHSGTIREIETTPLTEPSVDKATSYYTYTAELKEQSEELLAGFHTNVEIILEKKEDVVVIPTSYSKTLQKEKYVYVIEKGRLKRKAIKTGMIINGKQEITEGLAKNDRIIANPANLMRNNQEIFMPIEEKQVNKSSLKLYTKEQIARLIVNGMYR
ncbi:efflux RND transporter periplasmic adaptor subunit [Metabacillus arenae]|uniref:HlyD family efflux transporter periplasmic adaptor subunit n=1 Tax=Metabacillus arenae TaxID=2771434 RepID=A0A926RV69_9BACI|nr:HlyD family efflux transporter periplasmic adaptor subunit [Metabacillus arenae]MBD1379368.1 HlyD family efflux transporter periplasmic adaptor subunit [Metabacillus arenae]